MHLFKVIGTEEYSGTQTFMCLKCGKKAFTTIGSLPIESLEKCKQKGKLHPYLVDNWHGMRTSVLL